jgi:hypothetical protein
MVKRSERKRRRKAPAQPAHARAAGPEAPGVTNLGLGLGAVGVLVAVLGFWLITQGSITAAPLLLILAYLVLLPLALIR